MNKGEFVEATKCATGEFSLVPEGTQVKTNEGEVFVTPGQAMIVNEKKNSIFVTDITEILKRYVADPMNPASQKAFELLKEFEKKKAESRPEEIPGLFKELVDAYNALERKTKAYQARKHD